MLAIAVLASIVSFLDATLVNVALPAIGRDLGGGLPTQQWAVDAYLVTLGALILVAGSLSDLYGRLLVLRVGLVGFGVASLLVAAAPFPAFLIGARAVQGIAGALLVPSSLALITSTFRGRAQGTAIGAWTAWTSAATLAGPVVGGLFVDVLSWRYAFVLNVVPIAVTLVLLARLRARDVRAPGARIDLPGAVLATLGLAGTVSALIEQGELGWAHPAIWAPFGGGILLFAAFLVRQATARAPMMPLSLFRIRNFAWGNISTAFVYAALALSGFVLVVFLQQRAGFSATAAGLVSIPSTVLMVLFSSLVGRWSARLGPRVFMTVGPLLAAAGYSVLFGVDDHVDYLTRLLPAILVFGVGLTLTVAPLTSAILGSIEPARSGIASAVNNAVARVSGLLAVALVGVVTGGVLDAAGFARALVVIVALFAAGGVTAFAGIRRARAEDAGSRGDARAVQGEEGDVEHRTDHDEAEERARPGSREAHDEARGDDGSDGDEAADDEPAGGR